MLGGSVNAEALFDDLARVVSVAGFGFFMQDPISGR
jgi:hypothetical protein